jgi:hypothetical protein
VRVRDSSDRHLRLKGYGWRERPERKQLDFTLGYELVWGWRCDMIGYIKLKNPIPGGIGQLEVVPGLF